jgi:hypothetical protein
MFVFLALPFCDFIINTTHAHTYRARMHAHAQTRTRSRTRVRHIFISMLNVCLLISGYEYLLYESPRWKPGWRFTAGIKFALPWKTQTPCVAIIETKWYSFDTAQIQNLDLVNISAWFCVYKILTTETYLKLSANEFSYGKCVWRISNFISPTAVYYLFSRSIIAHLCSTSHLIPVVNCQPGLHPGDS